MKSMMIRNHYPDYVLVLIPSVVGAILWALFYGIYLGSMMLLEPESFARLPQVMGSLIGSSLLAAAVMVPVGIMAYVGVKGCRFFILHARSKRRGRRL